MASFKEIDKARKLLGLSSEATREEIKRTYRNKARKYHPDRSGRENKEEMARINRAYKILLKYIEEYRFSFKKEEVERNDPERDMRRFYKDWLGH